jgi:uncharacterized protein (DUF1800 family)
VTDATAHALIRFGLGPRAGETWPANPRAWLLDQLGPADPASFPGLPDTAETLQQVQQDRVLRKTDPDAANRAQINAHLFRAEASAALDNALTTDAPFRERLVWFWTNHFTVSRKRGETAPLIGNFIRTAIRPYVTGRFSDMLLAVMRHPAMLYYLDNVSSVGPNSPAGLRHHQGLNENLGRESLELHTVTPAAGYTQADVTSYAAILTGWTVRPAADPPGFAFRPETHEPGEQTLLGQTFPPGEDGGVQALHFLATHPSTYRALATALARHFIADDPPRDAVARLTAALQRSGGDLGVAAAAVVAEPAAWHPLTKLRSPMDYTVAVLRAAGPRPDDGLHLAGALNTLGQPLWAAPLPNGWPDRAPDWADPETMLRRADWVWRLAGRETGRPPEQVAAEALGGMLPPATTEAMAHAGSRRDALTLLFTSPQFMRR